MPEVLLKISDAAERLSVSRYWIYRRIESGELPVVELGSTRKNQRIRESDLDAFIEARTYGGGGAVHKAIAAKEGSGDRLSRGAP